MTKRGEVGPRRYGKWGGNPQGQAEDPARCVEGVMPDDRMGREHQCSFSRGHGRGGLYCKVHATSHPADGAPSGPLAYAVFEGYDGEPLQMQTAIIAREGAKEVTLVNAQGAFNYRARVPVAAIDRTPEAAWARALRGLRARLRSAELEAERLRLLLSQVPGGGEGS